MPRKPKRYVRAGPPCPLDEAFFTRAESALGVRLNRNARTLLALSIEWHNYCCHANEAAGTRFDPHIKGRASDANTHVFVDSILNILEGHAGVVVRVSKRQRQSDSGHPAHGPVAEFVRIIHDALIVPDRSAEALARLVANCASFLGLPRRRRVRLRMKGPRVAVPRTFINTMEARRKRRARAREPGEAYMARMRQAWKTPSE